MAHRWPCRYHRKVTVQLECHIAVIRLLFLEICENSGIFFLFLDRFGLKRAEHGLADAFLNWAELADSDGLNKC